MPQINGGTKICGIFGYPVEHSFSPSMHNAAFEHLSMNWAYVPFPVRSPDLPAAVESVRALGLAGVNVTVPHKQAVAGLVDELSPAAKLSGAVNTVINREGLLAGHNTDGEGFVRALREEAGLEAASAPVLIIGAGGAARAVAVALALSGAPAVFVTNRTEKRAVGLCRLLSDGTGCETAVVEWPCETEQMGEKRYLWEDVLNSVGLVVQTTSIGMSPDFDSAPPFPFHLLGRGHTVVDLVYNPSHTAFMKRCRAAGARVFNGAGMLLHQGAIAFELWTGRKAPLEVMRRALKEGIGN